MGIAGQKKGKKRVPGVRLAGGQQAQKGSPTKSSAAYKRKLRGGRAVPLFMRGKCGRGKEIKPDFKGRGEQRGMGAEYEKGQRKKMYPER